MIAECHWIGKGEGCGSTAVEGRSYCQDHIWLVYQQGTKLSRRNRDQERVARQRLISQLLDEAVQELEAEGHL